MELVHPVCVERQSRALGIYCGLQVLLQMWKGGLCLWYLWCVCLCVWLKWMRYWVSHLFSALWFQIEFEGSCGRVCVLALKATSITIGDGAIDLKITLHADMCHIGVDLILTHQLEPSVAEIWRLWHHRQSCMDRQYGEIDQPSGNIHHANTNRWGQVKSQKGVTTLDGDPW